MTEKVEVREASPEVLEVGLGCRFSVPPRLTPPAPYSSPCSSVDVREWSQQLRLLQAHEGLPRSNLAIWGRVCHMRRRQCCCHRVPIAGGLGRVALKGDDDEGRVDGGTFTQNARCMGLAGAPQESLMLPELHPRLSICWDFGALALGSKWGVSFKHLRLLSW